MKIEKELVLELCDKQLIENSHVYSCEKIRRVKHIDPLPLREETIKQMLPNTIAVIIHDKVYKIVRSNEGVFAVRGKTKLALAYCKQCSQNGKLEIDLDTNISMINTIITFPLCPWGNVFDLMFMYVGYPYKENAIYIEDRVLEKWLELQAKLIAFLQKKYQKEVYWGLTESISMLSVPYPHVHVSVIENSYSVEECLKFRDSKPENKVVDFVSTNVISNVLHLLYYTNKIQIKQDNCGWTIHIEDAGVNIFRNRKFLQLWNAIANGAILGLIKVHSMFYKSKLQDFYNLFLNRLQSRLPMSKSIYRKYFKPYYTISTPVTNELQQLKKLDLLREPLAWGQLVRFDSENRVDFFSLISIINQPIGPFESIGIKLAESSKTKIISHNEINELLEILLDKT